MSTVRGTRKFRHHLGDRHTQADDPVSVDDLRPQWRTLAIATVIAGVVMLPLIGQGVGLYLYAFPLFGLGIPYVLHFRPQLSRAWWITFIAITPLSVVALALDWPFSGHVLWNILFLAHCTAVVRSRTWTWLFAGSLVHLLTMKAIFQTPRDLLGAAYSAVVAGVIVLVLWRRNELSALARRSIGNYSGR